LKVRTPASTTCWSTSTSPAPSASRRSPTRSCAAHHHFSLHRLRNEDFEFPDLLGAAYEYLIGEFADSAGKKGGEFYTPRAVVRMMVRLAKPARASTRVYDPCSGSGGMLILSQGIHRRARRQRPKNQPLRPGGQRRVWSISKMNMILHGISDADLRNGDTLASRCTSRAAS
jgi:type I restriction enzyme M protein